MSETLLDKAIKNYNVAVMVYNSMDGDEGYLNYIGYHLQQSVELGMKYFLEKNGVVYPKTHDIDQLIRIADENDVDLLATEYIREHSEMLSLWEARTRYVLNYQLEFSKVERAMNGVDEYLDILQAADTKPENAEPKDTELKDTQPENTEPKETEPEDA
ncbi:MAG: HEPN domain-containing protein [Lachnospiraceae bacterium]|nr:HEPN domain-containing protein [Lachnospiraceae bacterium]